VTFLPIPVVTVSDEIYRAEALALRVDTVEMPDGDTVRRHVMEYRPACAVVVLDPTRGDVLLLRHYRHPVGRYLWDIPGGMIELGEAAAEAAAREVWEEAGVAIRDSRELLTFHPEPAFTDHRITLMEARADLGDTKISPDEHEIDTIRWVPHDEIQRMIHTGQIASSWSIIGLTMSLCVR
jgi:ADP-ribose pyrophosphatase